MIFNKKINIKRKNTSNFSNGFSGSPRIFPKKALIVSWRFSSWNLMKISSSSGFASIFFIIFVRLAKEVGNPALIELHKLQNTDLILQILALAVVVFGLSDPSAGPETIVRVSALDVIPPDLTVI